MSIIHKITSNKLVWYLSTRYLTYFIQFISSLVIAVKLGPFLFGIWGFILLILNYFRIIDFGISSATNFLVVQNKEDKEMVRSISWNAIYLVTFLNIGILFFALYYKFFGIPFFDKYEINDFFVLIIFVAIATNYNVLLMNLYRIQNSLKELSFYQSSIPVLMFILALMLKADVLLDYLLYANVGGNLLCLLIFCFGKKIPKITSLDWTLIKKIIDKGVFMFIYSISFYLIILSIKTLVSAYYTVEEFGIFSFSYTLGNSVLLFLQALTFVIFPKVISKLKGNDYIQIKTTLDEIRKSYVTMAFGLIFLFLMLVPFLLNFIPKYNNAFVTLAFINLTIVLYTNSFGYGTFLMAQNQERKNALISFTSLVLNLLIASVLILFFKVSYNYVIIATIIAYIFYTYLCVHYGKKKMGFNDGFLINFQDCFPLRLFIPYFVAIIIASLGLKYFMCIPFFIFIFLNINALKNIITKIKLLINKPNVIDL